MSYAEAGFPIDNRMFIYENALGKLSWEPSPEVIHELRTIADKAKDAPSIEERVASAVTFDVLYQMGAKTYLELLVLSLFGTGDGKTNVESYRLFGMLDELRKQTYSELFSPEMASVVAKFAIRKAEGD